MGRSPGRRRKTLFNRLSLRLALALGLGAGAVVLVAGMVNIATQRENMLDLAQAHADHTAQMVRRSTREAMLGNKPEEVQSILESIGGHAGIERIRIMDRNGRVRTSTHRDDVGTLIEGAEACARCHERGAAGGSVDDRACLRVLGTGREGRVLGVREPIPNEPACSTAECHAHAPEERVLGVLDIRLDVAEIDAQVAQSTAQMGVGLLATIALVLLLSGILSWYLVLRPVGIFTDATRRVHRGDLASKVPIDSTWEIGQMGLSWNAMVDELARARERLEQWSHTLEERVEEKTAQLEAAHEKMLVVERMASLGKLAAVMAHEINNPLAGIGTYAKLLQRRIGRLEGMDEQEAQQALQALQLMETESARCGRIVQNLLLFSRTPGARFVDTDVPALVERCVLLVNHRAEMQGVSIHRQVPPDLPQVESDPSQIQQALLALCMNALEAMSDGGRLEIAAALEGTELVLSVADTGIGIAAEDLPHVFEPFYTSKTEGVGVGLGLAVVYGVVTRHRGTIDVRSVVGEGTTFTIRLPREQPDEESEKAEPVGAADGGAT